MQSREKGNNRKKIPIEKERKREQSIQMKSTNHCKTKSQSTDVIIDEQSDFHKTHCR